MDSLLVPKLLLGNKIWCKALLCSKAGNPSVTFLIAKLELGAQVRPQSGAWGREKKRLRFI